MAHYDVVPVDESDAWTYPPFEGRIEDGWVYGRGALDDKGPLLVVLEAVENLLAAGFTPARDVYLSFGGNEETYGVAAAVDRRRRCASAASCRGSCSTRAARSSTLRCRSLSGARRWSASARRASLTLRLSARGEGGHASAPPRSPRSRRIARAIDRLDAGTFPARTPAAITRMLEPVREQGPRPRPDTAAHARRRSPPLTARVFAAMGGEPAALVRTTVAATMQSGGTAANVLPSQASATLNLRIALGETVPSTVRRVRRRIADPLVEVEVVESSEPSPESPTDNAQFALIADAVKASHPDAATVPYVMMAATDSRHFHRFSPAVYRFAPLEMSNAQRASIHGVDERVEIAALERGELFHRALLQRLQ